MLNVYDCMCGILSGKLIILYLFLLIEEVLLMNDIIFELSYIVLVKLNVIGINCKVYIFDIIEVVVEICV